MWGPYFSSSGENRLLQLRPKQYFCNVKFTSLLLTLIVFVLNVVPCCAWEHDNDDTLEIIGHPETPQQDNEDDCTNCSPFYSCGSCTASLEIPLPIIPISQMKLCSTAFNFELLLSYSEGVDTSIWQPPKKTSLSRQSWT